MATPKYTVIEKTAFELAATWYEIGRGQGMTSKFKNHREYARNNFKTFIPKAIELLTDMLGRTDISSVIKDEIHGALLERVNDPDLKVLTEPVAPIFELPKTWKDRIPNFISKDNDNAKEVKKQVASS